MRRTTHDIMLINYISNLLFRTNKSAIVFVLLLPTLDFPSLFMDARRVSD